MRILTISSGKGGVGKTAFAINFALKLSEYGKTLLLDLDTGTSSIRNTLKIPIKRDLYHFFRKGYSLDHCVSTLDNRLDPNNRFSNFGVIAGPKRMIDEITNLNERRRYHLIDAINSLNFKYVVLDLKAGLDANVIDFLPYSNTGIIIFTPHLPAATMAASDLVKAVLFKKLRNIFSAGSPIFAEIGMGGDFYYQINELINIVEDVYDEEFDNLDAFLVWLNEKLGDHRVVRLIANTVEYFRTYFVLNMFNETKESYEKAIQPFVENIVQYVSSRINIINLGCVINSPKMHEANCNGIPVLLYDDIFKEKEKESRPMIKFKELWKGLRYEKRGKVKIPSEYKKPDPDDQLSRQLYILKEIYTQTKDVTIEQNFDYIIERTLFLLQGRRVSDFGDTRLFKHGEILEVLFKRGR